VAACLVVLAVAGCNRGVVKLPTLQQRLLELQEKISEAQGELEQAPAPGTPGRRAHDMAAGLRPVVSLAEEFADACAGTKHEQTGQQLLAETRALEQKAGDGATAAELRQDLIQLAAKLAPIKSQL
jgi:hypothetical protein